LLPFFTQLKTLGAQKVALRLSPRLAKLDNKKRGRLFGLITTRTIRSAP
jgi:ribosomal protein L9